MSLLNTKARYYLVVKSSGMNKAGPIVIIEDDEDDRYLITLAFEELEYPNKLVFFTDGIKALNYLQDHNVYPFLILSDVNLPKLNGFELRKQLHSNEILAAKCIPYLFFSTFVNKKVVCDAYAMSVQIGRAHV